MKGVTHSAGLDGDCEKYFGWVIGINTTTLAVQGAFRTGEGGAADKGGNFILLRIRCLHTVLCERCEHCEYKAPRCKHGQAPIPLLLGVMQGYGPLVA
jgi:hypothetical protein